MSIQALKKRLDGDGKVSRMEEAKFTEAEDVAEKSTDIMLTRKYSNMEIVNLIVLALAYGKAEPGHDPIIRKSWKALDDTFARGYRQGYEEGYRAGANGIPKAELLEPY